MRHDGCRCSLEALEKESSVDEEGDDDGEKSVHEQVEFWLPESILSQPLQDIGFGMQVSPVNAGEATPEVDDSGKVGHSPFPGVPGVGHLHKGDVEVVGLAVDILQFFHDDLALLRIDFIWNRLVYSRE